MMAFIMLDPTEQAERRATAMAPRPATPAGLRVALLANGKPNGDTLLQEVATLLRDQYEVEVARLVVKPNAGRPAGTELLSDLLQGVDAAITAIGD